MIMSYAQCLYNVKVNCRIAFPEWLSNWHFDVIKTAREYKDANKYNLYICVESRHSTRISQNMVATLY